MVKQPVSLRDLPATVVDLLGMSAASPFPGRSLAAHWKLPPGKAPGDLTSPAFSERASTVAFQPQPEQGPQARRVSRCLWRPSGHHYVRNGEGAERLYDLAVDQYEGVNLVDSASGHQTKVTLFRKMLLDVLTDQPGSSEVENAYLATYRKWLEELVQRTDFPVTRGQRSRFTVRMGR